MTETVPGGTVATVTLPPALFAALGAVVGAVLASFSVVVAERIPRKETLGGRSHCVCGRQLTAAENLPIVGYLAVRGVARCCGTRIPVRYVAAEIAAAAVTAAIYTRMAVTGRFGAVAAVAAAVAVQIVVVAVCWTPAGPAGGHPDEGGRQPV